MNDARISERVRAEATVRGHIDERTAKCAVVGLGFIGVTVLAAVADAGFETSGIDRSAFAVDRARAVIGPSARLSTAPGPMSEADVVLIAIRIVPDVIRGVDLEPLDAVVTDLAALPPRPRLVVLMSTVPPGTTRALATKIGAGDGSFVAYAPERLQVDDPIWTIDRIPHIVGGLDRESTRLATQFVSTFVTSVQSVTSPEVAEMSKLLENSFNAVGIALIGELTPLAHEMGIQMAEVSAAAATKPFGYRAFHPGPGIGGHCIPNDLRMLRDSGRQAGVATPLLDETEEISQRLPSITVDRLADLLAARACELAGAHVLLIGLGFKVGTADTTDTPAIEVSRELRRRGALPFGVDSRCQALIVDGVPLRQVDHRSLGSGEKYDAAIVLAGDPAISGEALARSVHVVLDAGGGRALQGSLGPAAARL